MKIIVTMRAGTHSQSMKIRVVSQEDRDDVLFHAEQYFGLNMTKSANYNA